MAGALGLVSGSPPWLPHVEERGIKAGAGSVDGTVGHARPFRTEERHNPLRQLVCQEGSAMHRGRVRQPGRHLQCQLRHLRTCAAAYWQKGRPARHGFPQKATSRYPMSELGAITSACAGFSPISSGRERFLPM